MKERITQLKSRYQHYSAREKVILKICAAAIAGAVIYYAGMVPLDNMIQNSKATLSRQKETLNWMRSEIDKTISRSRLSKRIIRARWWRTARRKFIFL